MNKPMTAEDYAEQIRRCAQALSIAKNDQVLGNLAAGHTADRLKMFTDGNLDKRYQKLLDQFEFMAEEFEELEDLIVEYVKTLPLTAYDTGCTDAERFLNWMETKRRLTPEQQDFVACQRGRYALEFLAMEHRLEHIRFQEMAGLVESFTPEWGSNPDLWLHLNPIRVWSSFQTTVLLDEDDETPATVLFYAVREDIRTAVLEEEGLAVVKFLEQRNRARLDDPDWLETGLSRDERIEIGRDLAEIGLAAFG